MIGAILDEYIEISELNNQNPVQLNMIQLGNNDLPIPHPI